jgi:hypothetical protein
MIKPYLLLSFAIAIGALTLASSAQAAPPVRVDVQAITIEYKSTWSDTLYRVYAVDESGHDVVFGGLGAYVLDFTDVGTFRIPGTFSTNRLDANGLGFGAVTSGGGFIPSSSHSDPLKLWLTNTPRKPVKFSRTGSAGFHATFSYSNEQGYAAFDDDVVLEGSYLIELGNSPWVDEGHQFNFYRLFFDLRKPAE